MTHHRPEKTTSVTSDSNDLDMWNRSHTAHERIRYNQESLKQVYFGRLLWEFSHVVFFWQLFSFYAVPPENTQMNGCNQHIKTLSVTDIIKFYLN